MGSKPKWVVEGQRLRAVAARAAELARQQRLLDRVEAGFESRSFGVPCRTGFRTRALRQRPRDRLAPIAGEPMSGNETWWSHLLPLGRRFQEMRTPRFPSARRCLQALRRQQGVANHVKVNVYVNDRKDLDGSAKQSV